MALKLIKGSLQYKNQIIEMIKEWKSYNDTHNANTSPWAIFKNDYDDFEYYLNNLETSTTDNGFVPDSTFFCLDCKFREISMPVPIGRHAVPLQTA